MLNHIKAVTSKPTESMTSLANCIKRAKYWAVDKDIPYYVGRADVGECYVSDVKPTDDRLIFTAYPQQKDEA